MHRLGILENNSGNRATAIRELFMDGHTTKDDFEKALRDHQASNDEMKSDIRGR